jgi:hypothetical protein
VLIFFVVGDRRLLSFLVSGLNCFNLMCYFWRGAREWYFGIWIFLFHFYCIFGMFKTNVSAIITVCNIIDIVIIVIVIIVILFYSFKVF